MDGQDTSNQDNPPPTHNQVEGTALTRQQAPHQEPTVTPNRLRQKTTSKKSSKSSTQPDSVLKAGKYGPSLQKTQGATKDKATKKYDHKHKNILVELGIDFAKDALAQFEADNGKKVVFAIQQWILNLSIGDKTANLNPTEADNDAGPLGG
jgi:hypothetical protein